jgi:DNA-binding MarR family transcriptional regulator
MIQKSNLAVPSSNQIGDVVTNGAVRDDGGTSNLRMATNEPEVAMLHGTLLALVRRDGRDLTARQLTAFLTVYMDEATHTVSSLAALLNISRPGVTRIMDRLVQFDLVAREEDREDRRRVLVRRTARGASFFRELAGITRSVANEVRASRAG